MKTRAMKSQALQARALVSQAKAAEGRTRKHILRGTVLAALALCTAALLAPAPSQATVVVATRVGNVAVRISDAPRLTLAPVGQRSLRSVRPLTAGPRPIVRGSCIDGRPRRDGRCDKNEHRGLGRRVWNPGHWEKTYQPQAHGRRHVHRAVRKIWGPRTLVPHLTSELRTAADAPSASPPPDSGGGRPL